MPDINEQLEISEKIRFSQYEQLVLIQKKLAQASKEITYQKKHIDELKKKTLELEELYDAKSTQFQDCQVDLRRSDAEINKVRNIVLTLRPSIRNPNKYTLPKLVSETLDVLKKKESDDLKKKAELEALLEKRFDELAVLTEKMVVAETQLSALQQEYEKLSLLHEEEVLSSVELDNNIKRIEHINLSLSDELVQSEYAQNQAQSHIEEQAELNVIKDKELLILTRQLILLEESYKELESETTMHRDDSIQLRRTMHRFGFLAEQFESFEKENVELRNKLRKLEKTCDNYVIELSILTKSLSDEQHSLTTALLEIEKREKRLEDERKKSLEIQTELNEKVISLKKQSEAENIALKDKIAKLNTSLSDGQHSLTTALSEIEKRERRLEDERKKSLEIQTELNEKIISFKKQSEAENSALKDKLAKLNTSLSNAKSNTGEVQNQLELERACSKELEITVKELENSRAFHLKAKKAKEDFQNDINHLAMIVSSPKNFFLHPFKFMKRLKQLNDLISIHPQMSQLIDNNCFDDCWYTRRYVDIEAGRYNAVRHFIEFGWKEERKPNKDFSFAKLRKSSGEEELSLQTIIDNLI